MASSLTDKATLTKFATQPSPSTRAIIRPDPAVLIRKFSRSAELFSGHKGPALEALYCFWVLAMGLAVNAVTWYMSVTIVRQLLIELEHARSISTIFLAIVFSSVLCLILGIFAAVLIGVLIFPAGWSALWMTMTIPVGFSGLIAPYVLILSVMVVLAVALGGAAGPLELLVALMPVLTVALALLFSFVVLPWRHQAHLLLKQVLLRLSENPKTPLASIAILLTCLVAIMAWVAHHLQS
jgi:hypothetical protein